MGCFASSGVINNLVVSFEPCTLAIMLRALTGLNRRSSLSTVFPESAEVTRFLPTSLGALLFWPQRAVFSEKAEVLYLPKQMLSAGS